MCEFYIQYFHMVQTVKTPENNRALSEIFSQMADCYRYMGIDERFRAIAYDTVAKTLNNMKEDVSIYSHDKKKLDEIRGVGESIAEKIIEYLNTGKIKTFELLRKKVPFELLDLMRIDGFGPATLRTLHDQLGINNKAALIAALENNRLTGISRFGEKKIENLKRALKIYRKGNRIPLIEALKTGNEILGLVENIKGVEKADLAGSLRRKKETVGDIDIIIQADLPARKKIADALARLPFVKRVLVKGMAKVTVISKQNDLQLDFRLTGKGEYGAALLYFTGSKEHNIQLRTKARELGYKINEYGVFNSITGEKVAGESEEGIYAFLHLPFIPPEQREVVEAKKTTALL